MATVPSAVTRVANRAKAAANSTDLCCVIAPCALSADFIPRQFGSADALVAQNGYCEGAEYAAEHFVRTGKAVLFLGIPISVPGVISRVNQKGNTGSSVVTVTAGSAGVLTHHDGAVTILQGGVVGTDQIVIGITLDGRVTKPVRLGTGNAYTIPLIGAGLGFGAGSLVAGDTVLTWHGSSPRSSSADWAAAFDKLGKQQKLFRSTVLVGDLQNSTEAAAYAAQLDAYLTVRERFIYGRAAIKDRLPYAALSQSIVRMTGAPSVTFAATTATRAAGSWIADGFVVGDVFTVAGSTSNNGSKAITALSATVLTFASGGVGETTANATITASPGLTFAEVGATGDTLTRSRGSWLDDGFRAGDIPTIAGTASNNFTSADGLTAVTALTLTFNTQDLTPEVIASSAVTMTAGQTKAAWMASSDAAFASIDGEYRIDLSAGMGRYPSSYSGWNFRRPAGWFASWREYSHDLQVTTFRKSDGNVGADLNDVDGETLVEWDDRVGADGGAGSAARFTTLRTWGNGPGGGFVTQSLTRASDGDILSLTSNVAVTNLACTVVQSATEDAAIGVDLLLNPDGTATGGSLKTIETKVNSQLAQALLQNNQGEGQRCSSAVWTADPSTIFNVPEAALVGVLVLELNGVIHKVTTTVAVS